VLAVEASFASVIGGAPAAAVVFAGEVDSRTASDPARGYARGPGGEAEDSARATLVTDLDQLRAIVRSQKLGEVAAKFDRVHSIERARMGLGRRDHQRPRGAARLVAPSRGLVR
jgi:hypothetical protein